VKRCLLQRPVYFINTLLRDAMMRYPQVQKLLLGVLLALNKLRHYFESHRITVVNSYSLGRMLHNRSATGCIAEWAMELSGFDLHFTAATANQEPDDGGFRHRVGQSANPGGGAPFLSS
jgi:hypothetical protein